MQRWQETQSRPVRDQRDATPPVLGGRLGQGGWRCRGETVPFGCRLGDTEDRSVPVTLHQHQVLPELTPVRPREGLVAVGLRVAAGVATGGARDSSLADGAQELRRIRVELTPVHLQGRRRESQSVELYCN